MINQIVAASMLAEGVFFGALAYVFYRRKKRKLASWRRMSGQVVEVRERDGSDGTLFHPVICYTDDTGKQAVFESKSGSSHRKFKVGVRLEILCHPSQPCEAEVAGFMVQWGLPAIFGAVAVTSFLGGAAGLFSPEMIPEAQCCWEASPCGAGEISLVV